MQSVSASLNITGMKLSDYLSVRGAQANLANALGVDTQLVWQWTSGVRRIPAERCVAIEELTHCQVRCEDLRPDVNWGVLRGTAAPEQKEAA